MASVVNYKDKEQFVQELDFLFNERGILGILYDYCDNNYIKVDGEYYKFPVNKLKQIYKNYIEYLTDIIHIHNVNDKEGGSISRWFKVSYFMNLITKQKIKNTGSYQPLKTLERNLKNIRQFLMTIENHGILDLNIIYSNGLGINKDIAEDFVTIINSGELIIYLSNINVTFDQNKLKNYESKYRFGAIFF